MPAPSPSAITDLLPASGIALDVVAPDWRSAIREAGDLLVREGVAGGAYTESMVRTVEEHGPYIVITPGFALAHARPDDSVARTGMSFVRLAEPVAFGHESNDPVTIVMALAAADDSAHQQALAALAGALADPGRRAALDTASSADEVLAALDGDAAAAGAGGGAVAPSGTGPSKAGDAAESTPSAVPADPAALADAVPSKNLILTVCGNGLGTSLFLKNTAEQVLDRWGWSPYLTVEATDTISAKGRAKEADFLLTSGAIAQTLGDVGVPVEVIENFTSLAEIDAALRRLYAV
ncbi:PTS sugar transporter subunit IIA [Brachybacterium halotolerans subsp. kimchii]|uniref:PTS sugar transporter subunit IIA n=1 Tax=Brachybacterium halotolerans TaxID=2795215 RepID=UPI001E4D259A|nr:PTS sugar transporter subunit IIA [Brachybacterium halotolerans]UEJ81557.1 PTS sugar transporter subunit IIA [Brachybacterium halotolerans subsp. kimchii]